MCGRITLTIPDRRSLAGALGLSEAAVPEDYAPRTNIAPGQFHLILRDDLTLQRARWGLVPHWAKDASFARRTINARAETVHRKPAFREAFRRRRCVVVADGFYEWKGPKGDKVPYWIHPQKTALLPLAGLWDTWRGPDGPLLPTFTVVTCRAHPALARIHDRMPVLLSAADQARWLDPSLRSPEALADVLSPHLPVALELRPVSRAVNDVRHEGPALLDPAGPCEVVAPDDR